MTKKPSDIVKKRENRPCGCVVVEYSDDRKEITPCIPCGLASAGQSMMQSAHAQNQAAQALLAIATRLRTDENNAAIAAATKNIHQMPKR